MADENRPRCRPIGLGAWLVLAGAVSAVAPSMTTAREAAGTSAEQQFDARIRPLLEQYCWDCHGGGMDKGKVAFDEPADPAKLIGNKGLWHAVLKNLRADLMPPEKKPRPTPAERAAIESWIIRDALGLDPANPDPGRVTLRRLNRVEYRNTIRDLTGFEIKVEEELPPDDSGYGFDNIGDVLTLSPLLLEKYMRLAETIASEAVPRQSRVVAESQLPGSTFRAPDRASRAGGDRMSFYEPASVAREFSAPHAGRYRLKLDFEVLGQFDFDPGRCRARLTVAEREVFSQEFAWHNRKSFAFDIDVDWAAGPHRLALHVEPLTPAAQKKNSLDLRLAGVRVQGPLEREHWVRPKNFERFFAQDPPRGAAALRREARNVLRAFATRAYRAPADPASVNRLAALAESVYTQPGKRFEDGIAEAIVPLLASPRFLFRIENHLAPAGKTDHPLIDEYALASRLSYFLWSTMPDAALFQEAAAGTLRRNLRAQVDRMLHDSRSEAFIENFVGQWLQVRDVEGIDINARAVLARDGGEERELERQRRLLREQREREARELQRNPAAAQTPDAEREREAARRRQFFRPRVELDRELRRALRLESELAFAHVARGNRSVLELIDPNYTFLNERLAAHYGLTNLQIKGPEMRQVELPPDSPRGGVLTHGSVLIVTSNPTRTSPVKRGLFVLDNILGTPPPPPPADVPQLEESEKAFKDREPTLREVLEIHRKNSLCRSCHERMDPLGLALENFNALGMWREAERGQRIDTAAKLITGESFSDIRQAKKILATDRRLDFYRCLTEKLLTYALGRGLAYYDVPAVDRIVDQLEREQGAFAALLFGVVDSAPFQRRRNPAFSPAPESAAPVHANLGPHAALSSTP